MYHFAYACRLGRAVQSCLASGYRERYCMPNENCGWLGEPFGSFGPKGTILASTRLILSRRYISSRVSSRVLILDDERWIRSPILMNHDPRLCPIQRYRALELCPGRYSRLGHGTALVSFPDVSIQRPAIHLMLSSLFLSLLLSTSRSEAK